MVGNVFGFLTVVLAACSWLLFFRALGKRTSRLLFGGTRSGYAPWDHTWIGIFVLMAWFQLVHLFVPITIWTLLPPLAFVAWRARLRPPASFKLPNVSLFGVCAFVLLVAALWCTRQPYNNADTGYYHLSTMRYYTEYPIIRGQGHLNNQYAFNQVGFLFGSMFRLMPLDLTERPFLNPLLWWIAMLPSLRGSLHLLWNRRAVDALSAVHLAALPMWLFFPFLFHLQNPTPDTHTAIFSLRILELVVHTFVSRNRKGPLLVLAAWTIAWSILIKLTIGFIALGSALAVTGSIAVSLAKRRLRISSLIRPMGLTLVILGVSISVWLYRGYLLSGVPGHPIANVLNLPEAPWAMRGYEFRKSGRLAMNRSYGDKPLRRQLAKRRSYLSVTPLEERVEGIDFSDPNASWNRPELWRPVWLNYAGTKWHFSFPLSAAVLLTLATLSSFLVSRRGLFLIPLAAIPILHAYTVLTAAPLLRYLGITLWLYNVALVAVLFLQCSKRFLNNPCFLLLGTWCGLFILQAEYVPAYHIPHPDTGWWDRAPRPTLDPYTSDGGVTWSTSPNSKSVFDADVPAGTLHVKDLHYLDPEKGLKGGVYVPR